MSKTFRIQIKTVFDNKVISLPVTYGSKIGSLKKKFGALQNVDSPQINLYHDGEQLGDNALVPAPSNDWESPRLLHAWVATKATGDPITQIENKTAEHSSSKKLAEEDEDDDGIEVTENQLRLSWDSGSWVEIFSNTKSSWHLGHIVKKFEDTEGEWLEIGYETVRNGQNMRKQVQRFCQDVRPISIKNLKNRNLTQKEKQAIENQRELRLYVKKCVLKVKSCLERPIDLPNIDAQIKELRDVIEQEGRLHDSEGLKTKLKVLNGAALENATLNAKSHLDLASLEKAIAKYGEPCNPAKLNRAREKMKELKTFRVDSVVQSVTDPKDIHTLAEILNDPTIKIRMREIIEEKVKALKNTRLLGMLDQAIGLRGFVDISKQFAEDEHILNSKVKERAREKIKELRAERVNFLLKVDDLSHLESKLVEWSEVIDEETRLTVESRIQDLRVRELRELIEQSNDFGSMEKLMFATESLERKTRDKVSSAVSAVLREAQVKLRKLVTDYFNAVVQHSGAFSNVQIVELENAVIKTQLYCPSALSLKVKQHIFNLCEANLTRCMREVSAVDPARVSDHMIDNLRNTYIHFKSNVPVSLSTRALKLLQELSTLRLRRAVSEIRGTEGLKRLQARCIDDSKFASEFAIQEAQRKIDLLLEKQLNELLTKEQLPKVVLGSGGNIVSEYGEYEELIARKLEHSRVRFSSLDDIPRLSRLLTEVEGLDRLVYENRLRELRTLRLRARVIDDEPLNVSNYEKFHLEDEGFCEEADRVASQKVICEMRTKKLQEVMDMVRNPAAALEHEIEAASLWVDGKLQENANDLLFDLTQQDKQKQVFDKWEKIGKQKTEKLNIPVGVQQILNGCLHGMAAVWAMAKDPGNLERIEQIAHNLHEIQSLLQVLQHYEVRKKWIVGTKVEILKGEEWLPVEITKATVNLKGETIVGVSGDNSINSRLYSVLDPRLRICQPSPRRYRENRRGILSKYGMNLSEWVAQKEKVSEYNKFLYLEQESKRSSDKLQTRVQQRWKGCKALYWTLDDVMHWLQNLGRNYAQYESKFRAQNVSGPMLLEMSRKDLEKLISSRLHQKKIKIEIQKLRSPASINKISHIASRSLRRRNSTVRNS